MIADFCDLSLRMLRALPCVRWQNFRKTGYKHGDQSVSAVRMRAGARCGIQPGEWDSARDGVGSNPESEIRLGVEWDPTRRVGFGSGWSGFQPGEAPTHRVALMKARPVRMSLRKSCSSLQ